MAKWTWCVGVACLLAIAACDPAPRAQSEPSSQALPQSGQRPSSSGPATTPTCPPTAQHIGSSDLRERQGVGDGATLWALFFAPLTPQTEIKVVWRMTGSGDFSISATGPDGTVVNPVWGPERHISSDWHRPGEEWGTGWVFPSGGCWIVNAKRTNGSAYLVVWLTS